MKLDLGGGYGHHRMYGFEEVDLEFTTTPGITLDLRIIPYPWEDNSVELIHCSHTLEHLHKLEAINLIRECYRILQPGGVLTIAVPDMDIFIEGHLTGDWSKHPASILSLVDLNYLAGEVNPPHERWTHRYMWCFESLAYVLEKSGFVEVERHGHYDGRYASLFPNAYNCDFSTISLYVDAVKPRV